MEWNDVMDPSPFSKITGEKKKKKRKKEKKKHHESAKV